MCEAFALPFTVASLWLQLGFKEHPQMGWAMKPREPEIPQTCVGEDHHKHLGEKKMNFILPEVLLGGSYNSLSRQNFN